MFYREFVLHLVRVGLFEQLVLEFNVLILLGRVHILLSKFLDTWFLSDDIQVVQQVKTLILASSEAVLKTSYWTVHTYCML